MILDIHVLLRFMQHMSVVSFFLYMLLIPGYIPVAICTLQICMSCVTCKHPHISSLRYSRTTNSFLPSNPRITATIDWGVAGWGCCTYRMCFTTACSRSFLEVHYLYHTLSQHAVAALYNIILDTFFHSKQVPATHMQS